LNEFAPYNNAFEVVSATTPAGSADKQVRLDANMTTG
jgi:hypothetical protein